MDLRLLQLSLIVEVVAVLGAAILSIFLPRKLERRLRDIGAALSHFADSDGRCYAALATGSLAACVFLAALRFPEPEIHDEFAYLLSADTFASGRLTNPTHPHWQHFETFHVIHQPSYQGKYPPAQSLFLAVGQLLGHSIIGVWISAVLMCVASYWMLRAFVPSVWALLGGIIPIMRFSVLLPATGYGPFYWIASYWGGMVAGCGAALLVGGAARMSNRPSIGAGLAVGGGLALLANSRPFEGLILAIPVLGWVVVQLFGGGWRKRIRALAATMSVLLLTGVAMLSYNRVVTGNALTMPYALHERAYNPLPFFAWQEMGEKKAYRHWVMERFYEDSLKGTAAKAIAYARGSLLRLYAIKSLQLFGFTAGPAFLITVVSLPAAWRERNFKLAIAALCFQWLAILPCLWFLPHYAAPMSSIIILVEVILLQKLAKHQVAGKQVGTFLVASVFAGILFSFGLGIVRYSIQHSSADLFAQQRQDVIGSLTSSPAQHLVLVRYDPETHNPDEEWVYNGANIDSQQIVWGRDMGADQNAGLVKYFQGRQIWLLEPDHDPVRLQPIDASGQK